MVVMVYNKAQTRMKTRAVQALKLLIGNGKLMKLVRFQIYRYTELDEPFR